MGEFCRHLASGSITQTGSVGGICQEPWFLPNCNRHCILRNSTVPRARESLHKLKRFLLLFWHKWRELHCKKRRTDINLGMDDFGVSTDKLRHDDFRCAHARICMYRTNMSRCTCERFCRHSWQLLSKGLSRLNCLSMEYNLVRVCYQISTYYRVPDSVRTPDL